ncbi:MAG: hypothetical protein IPL23_02790 [Saprospiraceae bacterium]|nr:hypothetical protein [Saprospiraceae bacterium]
MQKFALKLGQLYAEAGNLQRSFILSITDWANKLNDRDMLAIKGLIDIYLITENWLMLILLHHCLEMEIDSNNVGLLFSALGLLTK